MERKLLNKWAGVRSSIYTSRTRLQYKTHKEKGMSVVHWRPVGLRAPVQRVCDSQSAQIGCGPLSSFAHAHCRSEAWSAILVQGKVSPAHGAVRHPIRTRVTLFQEQH